MLSPAASVTGCPVFQVRRRLHRAALREEGLQRAVRGARARALPVRAHRGRDRDGADRRHLRGGAVHHKVSAAGRDARPGNGQPPHGRCGHVCLTATWRGVGFHAGVAPIISLILHFDENYLFSKQRS